jgi:hypothetical protein
MEAPNPLGPRVQCLNGLRRSDYSELADMLEHAGS